MSTVWLFASAGVCAVLAMGAVWYDRARSVVKKPSPKLKGEAFTLPVVPYKAPIVSSPGKWAFALYQAKPLLSEWERKVLFGVAKQIPKNCVLLSQVRYADFIGVEDSGRRSADQAFYKIASKSADLVVMNRWTGKVVLVVELDDDTHQRTDRKIRDKFIEQMLEHVKIPMLRFTPRDHVNLSSFFENYDNND